MADEVLENLKMWTVDPLCTAAARRIEEDGAEIERLRAALLPVAKIPLWRDTYPDAKDDFVADDKLNFVTPAQIREARRLCGHEQSVTQEDKHGS